MLKRIMLLILAAGFCSGMTCRLMFPGGGDTGGGDDTSDEPTSLAQVSGELTITQEVGGSSAEVVLTMTKSGQAYRFEEDQRFLVDDEELSDSDRDGDYTATVDTGAEYLAELDDPVRGTYPTTLEPPADFQITSTATPSLQGFALEWSNPDTDLQVEIHLYQNGNPPVERVVGPYTDDGNRTLTLEQLADFGQGKDLFITVTKIRAGVLNGFRNGTYEARVSATQTAEPTF